jgi:hypothetical protein
MTARCLRHDQPDLGADRELFLLRCDVLSKQGLVADFVGFLPQCSMLVMRGHASSRGRAYFAPRKKSSP